MTDIWKEHVVCQVSTFPKGFVNLYHTTKIENAAEGLTVLLHTIMLEMGFIPKDVLECTEHEHMPENWKTNGVFKIKYYHKCSPHAYCWMTSVPMYSTLAVHGAVDNENCHEDVNIKLQLDSYIYEKEDFTDPSKVFIHTKELFRDFKDGFCFPLLVLIQHASSCKPFFGLSGLIDELKMCILTLLPVKDVISLSAVNKGFNYLANAPPLWKYLFQRDFRSGELIDFGTDSDKESKWKDLYISKYLQWKSIRSGFPNYHQPYRMPWKESPVNPDSDIDLSINFDPALQVAFPHLRRRFQPSQFFQPFDSIFRRFF